MSLFFFFFPIFFPKDTIRLGDFHTIMTAGTGLYTAAELNTSLPDDLPHFSRERMREREIDRRCNQLYILLIFVHPLLYLPRFPRSSIARARSLSLLRTRSRTPVIVSVGSDQLVG